MRNVRRASVIVPTLAPGGLGERRARQHEADRSVDPTVKLGFPEHWNNPDVRGALYAMHRRTCAYCGCYLPRNDRGDVEHFRPKARVDDDLGHGGYWWVAYNFDNYLLSCSTCNSVRKGNWFPLRPRSRRVTYDTRSKLPHEARVLFDPTIDSVEKYLRAEWEEELCPIRAQGGLAGVIRKQVEGTLKLFKINTDPDLVKERIAIRDTVLDAIDDGHPERVNKLAIRYSPHSLVAKQLLLDRAPAHLPTPEDELRWLLSDIVKTLDITLKLKNIEPEEIQRRKVDELLWSLAVIWCDPPVVTAKAVEDFLTREGILEDVREFYDQL